MRGHVNTFGALFMALVFACFCMPLREAVAYSPARSQQQKQGPHRNSRKNVTPSTALVAPSALLSTDQKDRQPPLKAGQAAQHHQSSAALLQQTASEVLSDQRGSRAAGQAGTAVTGATIAGAAAVAGVAIGSAAAAAGAAAASGPAVGVPSANANKGARQLEHALKILGIDMEHADDKTEPDSNDDVDYSNDHIDKSGVDLAPDEEDTEHSPEFESRHRKIHRGLEADYEDSWPSGEDSYGKYHADMKHSHSRAETNDSPSSDAGVSSSATRRKRNTHLSAPHRSDGAFPSRVALSPSLVMQQQNLTSGATSLQRSLIWGTRHGGYATASRSVAVRRGSATSLADSSRILQPFVFGEFVTQQESNGETGSAGSPVPPASKESEKSLVVPGLGPPSDNTDVDLPQQKPAAVAWLCRISEPHKGCNNRLYRPGMNDRVAEGTTSAGKAYPGASCPEGFCCSRTACSSAGCGEICSDNSILCFLRHEGKSYGKGCNCANQPAPRCHPLAKCVESLSPGGGVWCECPEGYKGNGLVCCGPGETGPGCDNTVRRPGLQPAKHSRGSRVFVQGMALWLLFATSVVR